MVEYGSVFSDQKWSWKTRISLDFWISLHHCQWSQEEIEERAAFPIAMVGIIIDVDGPNDWIEKKFQVKAFILGWMQVDLSIGKNYVMLICFC